MPKITVVTNAVYIIILLKTVMLKHILMEMNLMPKMIVVEVNSMPKVVRRDYHVAEDCRCHQQSRPSSTCFWVRLSVIVVKHPSFQQDRGHTLDTSHDDVDVRAVGCRFRSMLAQ